jgi:hypothetical protein
MTGLDTDFIEISFGGYGLLVVWGPYGRFQCAIFASLENTECWL